MAISKLDQLMIKSMVGERELGQYAIAVKLVEIWQFVPLAVISALYPSIIKSRTISDSNYYISSLNLYSLLAFLSLLFAICTSMIGQWIINVLYQDQCTSSGLILVFYSWTTVFTYFSLGRMRLFVIENKIIDAFLVAILVLVLNFSFNIIFIKNYAGLGAVLASLLSFMVANIVTSIYNQNIRQSCIMFFKGIVNIPTALKGLVEKF